MNIKAQPLYVALYCSDPELNTNCEATYLDYKRILVDEWDNDGDSFYNVSVVQFPESKGIAQAITHFGLVFDEIGETKLFGSGPLEPELFVCKSIQVEFAIGDITVYL